MKKYDVIALGELLVDFTMNGISGQGRCFGIDRGKETVKKDEGNRNIIGQYL